MLKKHVASINILFLVGLLIRIILFPVTTSHYMTELFIPFIDTSILNPGVNPWNLSGVQQFPYGLISFLIFYIPKLLGYLVFGVGALGSGTLSLALMKLPLLGFDILALKTLQKFLPDKKRQVYWLYWLNPLVIYLTFAYSHMDIISVALFLLSLYFILQKRNSTSALFFGMAVASKFYVFAALPFILVYIWNTHFSREALRKMAVYILIVAVFILIGFSLILLAHSFGYATLSSPEALRIFSLKIFFDPYYFYFGLAIFLMTLFRLILSTKITPQGLFLGSYFIFGVLTFVSSPLLNWYLWVLPGIVFFYFSYKSFHRYLVLLFIFSLTVQIAVQLFSLNLDAASLFFTITQTSFLLLLITMWFVALKREVPLGRRMTPFLVGISGNSGAGKNHTSHSFSQLFGFQSTQIIEGDNYHRWQRGDASWSVHTHLQPAANHLSRMLSHSQDLKLNKEIKSTHYDHDNGEFTLPKITQPERLIVFQGLHTFYLNEMRDQLDMKIYLNPDENVRLYWKIQRDVQQRQYSLEKVLETNQKRKLDSEKYVEPQMKYADWIIEFFSREPYTAEMAIQGLAPQVSIRHIFSNDYHDLDIIAEVINKHAAGSAKISDFKDDFTKIIFEVSDAPSSAALEDILNVLDWPLRQITKSWQPPVWETGFNGLTQILALMILKKKGFNE